MTGQDLSGYALKFISGKYQGGEFPLKPDKQVVIGRSSELDMVLVEDMVSRKHARIFFDDGRLTIEDLGSTNGTFVNGEKVKTARLKEGDRVLIGTSILKVIRVGAESGPELDDEQLKQKLEEVAASQSHRQTKTAMTGKLDEVPLPDLLQLFHTSKKSGVLVIRNENEGKLYLKQGRVYFACINNDVSVKPGKSFNRIITWEKGDFELLPLEEHEPFPEQLESSTEALLMEGLRQLDEIRRLQPELPAGDAVLAIPDPLSLPLRDLPPEELDAFQLALNYRTFTGAMLHCEGDDVTTAQDIASLIRKGYLTVVGH